MKNDNTRGRFPSNTANTNDRFAVVGVDTGGTFTDFILRVIDGPSGTTLLTTTHKRLSTPDDPGEAVIAGLEQLLADNDLSPQTHRIVVVHGSTVATNALLERRGAATAFVTTEGFEDLLAIGRQSRRHLYDLAPQPTPALVDPTRCYGAPERVDSTGDILQPLNDDAVDQLVRAIVDADVDSVAVCLLFSFQNPTHEARITRRLREAGLFVAASHELLPEHREYERASTTAVNAYVSPLMQRYLAGLHRRMNDLGMHRLHIMQSSGGTISPEHAGTHSVHTLLSGPAGGVVGAFTAVSRKTAPHVITLDMGGTSTDVALIPGRLPTTNEGIIDGIPIRVPLLDIQTVGAGGGSIARIDGGGALTVGPESAGARPGPACYGLGGEQPTVTDAHVVLGRLPTTAFLGGHMRLHPKAATDAVRGLARQLDASVNDTAAGMLRVANVQMERALRFISVERGYDPRQFTLVCYGGAGGLHAVDLARSLGIPQVMVPPHAGVFSAWGMAVADVVKTASHGIVGRLDDKTAEARKVLIQLMANAAKDLREEARFDGVIHLQPAVDLRYAGQSFELTVDMPALTWSVDNPALPDDVTVDPAALQTRFHQLHETRYGYQSDGPVEIVAVRLRATCQSVPEDRKTSTSSGEGSTATPSTPASVVSAWINGTWHETPVYNRLLLPVNAHNIGPAIVAEPHATVVIGPGDGFHVNADGYLWISVNDVSPPTTTS